MSYTLNGTFGVTDFGAGETITGNTSSNTAVIKADVFGNKAFTSFGSSDVKEITMAGTPTYTAQADLSSAYAENVQLSGTISISASSQAVTGVGFQPDLIWFKNRSACLLYTSPSPRDRQKSRMPSSA